MMSPAHTAPIFCCHDRELTDRFFRKYRIGRGDSPDRLIEQCAAAFSHLPYENLTKIIKSEEVLGPESALRYPCDVLADHLKWGTGGTCFSLTAALIAVFNALGLDARPLLADRHYGTDTHCGLAVMHKGVMLLIDPGFLFFVPTPLPETAVSITDLGYASIELCPIDNGDRVQLATVARGVRKLRLTYKRIPVDAETFRRAWIRSFTWEMMTYPVLTRTAPGQHFYLQGASATVRTSNETVRSRLEITEQIDFINRNMGIARDVVLKAWEVLHHGTA